MSEQIETQAPPTGDRTPKLRVMIRGLPADTPRKALLETLNENGVECSVSPTYFRKPGEYTATLSHADQRPLLEKVLNEKYVEPSQETSKPIVLKLNDLMPINRRRKARNRTQNSGSTSDSIGKQDSENEQETAPNAESSQQVPRKSNDSRRGPRRRRTPRATVPRPGAVHFNLPVGGTKDDVMELVAGFSTADVYVGKFRRRNYKNRDTEQYHAFVVITVGDEYQDALIEHLKNKTINGLPIHPQVSVTYSREPEKESSGDDASTPRENETLKVEKPEEKEAEKEAEKTDKTNKNAEEKDATKEPVEDKEEAEKREKKEREELKAKAVANAIIENEVSSDADEN